MTTLLSLATGLVCYLLVVCVFVAIGYAIASSLFPTRTSIYANFEESRKRNIMMLVASFAIVGILSPIVFDYPRYPLTLVTNDNTVESHPFGVWHRPFGSTAFVPETTLGHEVRVALTKSRNKESSLLLTFTSTVNDPERYVAAGSPVLGDFITQDVAQKLLPEVLRENPDLCRPISIWGVTEEDLAKTFRSVDLPSGTTLDSVTVTETNVDCCVENCGGINDIASNEMSFTLPVNVTTNDKLGIVHVIVYAKIADIARYIAHGRPKFSELLHAEHVRALVPKAVSENPRICTPLSVWLKDSDESVLNQLSTNEPTLQDAGIILTRVKFQAENVESCFSDGSDPVALQKSGQEVSVSDELVIPVSTEDKDARVKITLSGVVTNAVKYVEQGRPLLRDALGDEALRELYPYEFRNNPCRPLLADASDFSAQGTVKIRTTFHDALDRFGVRGVSTDFSFKRIPDCLKSGKDPYEVVREGGTINPGGAEATFDMAANDGRGDGTMTITYNVYVSNVAQWLKSGRKGASQVLTTRNMSEILPGSVFADTDFCHDICENYEQLQKDLARDLPEIHPDQAKKLADIGVTVSSVGIRAQNSKSCAAGTCYLLRQGKVRYPTRH